MDTDQIDTLNNNVDWNVFMENIEFDKLIASPEFDQYLPTHAVETVTNTTTADKCIQTDPEDRPPVFIDLTNAKKTKRRREDHKNTKKHKKRNVDPNEIIFIDSDDEESAAKETNTNDKSGSSKDTSGYGSGLTSKGVKIVRSMIKAFKPNEERGFSPQQTADAEQMVIIESDDEIQSTSITSGCNLVAFEQRPTVILNQEICQKWKRTSNTQCSMCLILKVVMSYENFNLNVFVI